MKSLPDEAVASIRTIHFDTTGESDQTLEDKGKDDTFKMICLREKTALVSVYSRPGDIECFRVRVRTRKGKLIWLGCPMREWRL